MFDADVPGEESLCHFTVRRFIFDPQPPTQTMTFTIGQAIRVKTRQQDEDTGTSIAGWSGRVIAFHSETGMLEVEWDSPTLAQLPDAYIRHSIDEGYDYFRYHIEAINVEAIEPQDTPSQVKAVQKALEVHYEGYEFHGQRPLPFSIAEREASSGTASKVAGNVKKELLALLKTIEGSGSFMSFRVHHFTHPGLYIEGIGEIGLPLTPGQAQDIIRRAHRAPFGKGSQTITDTSVRSAWEIDAGQLSFHNEDWNLAIREILETVKEGLGIEAQSVTASLYKLLLYEAGDFFLPHKDSEKDKGMFATLVVGLPSAHTGGELILRFDGREETVDFAPAASSYKMPFAAFYADCEHEVKPVNSGYRLCLVYNLLQSASSSKISSPQFGRQVGQMAELLQTLADTFEWRPQAVLLGHQYTSANFSLGQLKLHDRPRAEALMKAAEKAGYFATLGLVTLYRMGELEGGDYYYGYGRRRGRYYEDYDEEESGRGTMGEVHEEYTSIKHWGTDEPPGLGELNIREEDILTDFELGEEEPIEQEEEGYTGNAGMTMEYWYHYGAVIFWPKSQHSRLLSSTPLPVRLQWLSYYLGHWEEAELHPREYARQILPGFTQEGIEAAKRYNPPDFSAVATAFARLEDGGLLQEPGEALLLAIFENIKVENWVDLLQQYPIDAFQPIFQKAAATHNVFVIRHLLDILNALDALGSATLAPFLMHQVQQIPAYLNKVSLHELERTPLFSKRTIDESRLETARAIVEYILVLSFHKETDLDWVEAVLKGISWPLPRIYANEVLAPILLSNKYSGRVLAKSLHEACIQDLKARTAIRPSPPLDWKRETPKTKDYRHIWKILHPFLSSPTLAVLDYQQNESLRSEMERAVKSEEVDLRMETIRKGRPYTLKLIKTQASYDRALKEWDEDMALLEQLVKVGLG